MNAFVHDGLTFDVDDSGPPDGDVVVLLHGFPESKQAWRAVTPSLVGAGYRVLAPNQRGYSRGARPKARRAYTRDKLVGDVLALADAAGVARFHVVGHDWGGALAWDLAANHAERVKTATSLATPHPQAIVRSLMRSDQLLKSWYIAAFQLPLLPELAFRGGVASQRFAQRLVASGLPAEYVDAYMALLAEPGAARGALNWYRALPLSPPHSVGKAQVPTLFVYATADIALGRTAADMTGDYVTGRYRYEVLDGVSHWIPEEVPDRVAQLVVDFIGQD